MFVWLRGQTYDVDGDIKNIWKISSKNRTSQFDQQPYHQYKSYFNVAYLLVIKSFLWLLVKTRQKYFLWRHSRKERP